MKMRVRIASCLASRDIILFYMLCLGDSLDDTIYSLNGSQGETIFGKRISCVQVLTENHINTYNLHTNTYTCKDNSSKILMLVNLLFHAFDKLAVHYIYCTFL